MNRIERKEMKRMHRTCTIKRFFIYILSFIVLVMFLFTGLYTVDKRNRSMLMIENKIFFKHKQIDQDNHEIIFCGDNYLLNLKKINIFIDDTREKLEYGLEDMEIFIEEQSKLVNKVIDDFYKNNAE